MKPSAARVAARWLLGAAKGVKDLPEGVYVGLDLYGDELRVFFSDAEGEELFKGEGPIYGHVEAYLPASDTGPCLGAFIVRHAIATGGFGPLLYDLAMEAAGKRGLTADRKKVSPSALRVWDYYMNSRPDVRTEQLDHSPGADEHLTRTPKDDCDQSAARDQLDSPLAQVYYAKGIPTIRALERAGLLVRL